MIKTSPKVVSFIKLCACEIKKAIIGKDFYGPTACFEKWFNDKNPNPQEMYEVIMFLKRHCNIGIVIDLLEQYLPKLSQNVDMYIIQIDTEIFSKRNHFNN